MIGQVGGQKTDDTRVPWELGGMDEETGYDPTIWGKKVDADATLERGRGK